MKRIAFALILVAGSAFAQTHTSAAFQVLVVQSPPPIQKVDMSVVVAPAVAPVGTPVTITARVNGYGTTPGGQVLFSYQGKPIFEGKLVNGTVTCSVPGNLVTQVGTFSGVATYLPDDASAKIYY